MCYVFNFGVAFVYILQRLSQFAMAVWMVFLMLVLVGFAGAVGVAYGYNYSLAEYIYNKPYGQPFFLRGGRLIHEQFFMDQNQILQYSNVPYDVGLERYNEDNFYMKEIEHFTPPWFPHRYGKYSNQFNTKRRNMQDIKSEQNLLQKLTTIIRKIKDVSPGVESRVSRMAEDLQQGADQDLARPRTDPDSSSTLKSDLAETGSG
ncbi:hypothetical protein JYU34_005710 [Plutella xylostella]|uniref:Uncharacterized protein n=1 Tax=Plutella xylostella TaxID=51655 RepID=A0ABQ7QTX2_PLUXY|nr:hypothetical protein JYU34_005710 [Plutella xylostella]